MSVIFIGMCFVVRNLHNKESAVSRTVQEHVTESCIQLQQQQQQQQQMDGEKDMSGSDMQLGRFKSVETSSSAQYDSEAISPASSSSIISPCDEEKGPISIRLNGNSPTESSDVKGMEVQPSRLL
ncbi:hypothetical protein EIK77_003118 [Talaromyces pinophilus]|nr:hypothetical protein EIK77_003118 [Talaromyces pinophilus]